jgi:hypothetical protein
MTKRLIIAGLGIASLCLLCLSPALGQVPVQTKKLVASDGYSSEYFGYGVAIDGDTAAVGAYYHSRRASSRGAVYIYRRSGNWSFVKKIQASDGATYDYFGRRVALDGDTMIVGAYGNDDNGSMSGSAYIFERNLGGADNWGQRKKLLASDGASSDYFGMAVAVHGDYAIVGAPYDDDKGSSSGSAYIYGRNQGGANNWGQVKKITTNDGATYDYCTYWGVGIYGDTAMFGCRGDDDKGSYSGSAYFFKQNQGGTNNWGQVRKVTASDGRSSDYFGIDAAIDGDYAIVGAYGDDDKGSYSGSAYIFERNLGGPERWGQRAKLVASDGTSSSYLGYGVEIDGINAVAGAYRARGLTASYAGAAYAYSKDQGGTNAWGEKAKLAANDGATYDYLGINVGVNTASEDYIAGAYGDDDMGSYSGSAYIFEAAACPTFSADAGGPYDHECNGQQSFLTLNGQRSCDPSGAALTYSWSSNCPGAGFDNSTSATPTLTLNGPPPCPVVCNITLTVRNPQGQTASDTTTLTVDDTTNPYFVNFPSTPIRVPCESVPLPYPVVGADACDDDVDIDFSEVTIPGRCDGDYTLERTWGLTDDCSNYYERTRVLQVYDYTAPTINVPEAYLWCIWSPNHSYYYFTKDEFDPEIVENCSEPVTWIFDSCTWEDPGGDHDSTIDDCIFGPGDDPAGWEWVAVRAERTGQALYGRTYEIKIKATDDCGNASGALTMGEILIPHDSSQGLVCLKTQGGGEEPTP